MLADLAITIQIAGQAIGLIQHQTLEKFDHVALRGFRERQISMLGVARLAAMPANHLIQTQAGAVVSIRRRAAYTPKRRSAPETDQTAIELQLLKVFSQKTFSSCS